MSLDEANARVAALIEDELDPARRAKLVEVQLALGFPYALQVDPERLAQLRDEQAAPRRWSRQVWLAVSSGLTSLWCGAVCLLLIRFADRKPELIVPLAGFFIGLIHAFAGLITAWDRPSRGGASLLAWSWLCAPVFVAAEWAAQGREGAVAALCCTMPSLLVCLAAWRLRRFAT